MSEESGKAIVNALAQARVVKSLYDEKRRIQYWDVYINDILIAETQDRVVAELFALAPELLSIGIGMLDEDKFSGRMPKDLVRRVEDVLTRIDKAAQETADSEPVE